MEKPIIPETYEQWKHCIVVDCGLELTPGYIDERISSLQDPKDYYTQQFVRKYGQEYLQQVLRWFTQARDSAN